MDERDKEKFGDLIEGLALTFRVKVSQPFFAAYWLGLKDLPYAEVERACAKALSTCRFMPVPRELRDLAGAMGPDQKAILAWNAVKKAIREVGSYRSVEFDDGAVNAAIRSLGGWPRVCGTDSEELDKWTSKEFQRLYRELSALPLGQDLTRYLPGIHEASGGETLREAPARLEAGTGVPPRQLAAPDETKTEAVATWRAGWLLPLSGKGTP